MMAGLPIVCAFVAPDTLVREYDCGYQCDPNNREEVVKAIQNLSEMSQAELKSMGQKGRIAIEDSFTYQKLASRFESFF